MTHPLIAALAEPFPQSMVKCRIGSRSRDKTRGQALWYIDPRAVQRRLDDVFGAHWKVSYRAEGSAMFCRLSVRVEDQWIEREDGAEIPARADDKSPDPIKTACSDSFKRVASVFGIGRYLHEVEQKWVELTDEGRKFAHPPQLPPQFLPRGSSAGMERGQSGSSMDRAPAARQAARPVNPPAETRETPRAAERSEPAREPAPQPRTTTAAPSQAQGERGLDPKSSEDQKQSPQGQGAHSLDLSGVTDPKLRDTVQSLMDKLNKQTVPASFLNNYFQTRLKPSLPEELSEQIEQAFAAVERPAERELNAA